MATVNNTRRGVGAAALLVTGLLALSACGSDSDSDKSSAPIEREQPGFGDQQASGSTPAGGAATDRDRTEAAPPGTDGSADSVPAPPPDPSRPLDVVPAVRQLVIRATIGVQTDDVGAAVPKVIDIATEHGGQVYDSDVELGDPETAYADLVVKLPPTQAERFIAALRDVGTPVSRTQDTQDVTDQLTDLDARILAQTASVNSVRALMEQAKTLDEIVMIEQQVATRQTELERLLAARKAMGDQAALATITVHLTTAPPPVVEDPPVVEEPVEQHETGIGESFAKGWKAFVNVLAAVLVFVGYTAPFLVVGILVGAIVLVTRRRWGSPRSRSAAPPPPPAPAGDPRTSAPDPAGAARSR